VIVFWSILLAALKICSSAASNLLPVEAEPVFRPGPLRRLLADRLPATLMAASRVPVDSVTTARRVRSAVSGGSLRPEHPGADDLANFKIGHFDAPAFCNFI